MSSKVTVPSLLLLPAWLHMHQDNSLILHCVGLSAHVYRDWKCNSNLIYFKKYIGMNILVISEENPQDDSNPLGFSVPVL